MEELRKSEIKTESSEKSLLISNGLLLEENENQLMKRPPMGNISNELESKIT